MSNPLPTLSPGFQIGDYVLKTLLDKTEEEQVWLGEQISVKREVEIVCYYGANSEQFLANARVKAQVEDGILGLVYEAVPTEEFIALAREVLPNRSLSTLAQEGILLSPLEVTRIIDQVTGALDSLEKRNIAQEPLQEHHIRISDKNEVRLYNIAQGGEPTDDSNTRKAFAGSLRKLLEFEKPGATRMATLLDYIEGTETQEAISWSQAQTLANQVEGQLNAPAETAPQSQATPKKSKNLGTIIAACLVIGVVALAIAFVSSLKKEPKIEIGRIIIVPEGRYPRPDGGFVEAKGFRIDANEVTIGQYSEFMDAWLKMSEKEQSKLWHESRPESKTTVRPESWNDFFPIARTQTQWNGLDMSLDCPVMNVDFWDAWAYAKWKGGRLPTEQEWWIAANSSASAREQGKDWGPVGGAEEKIYGLAGDVAEWAGCFTKNPAFPIESAKPTVLGSSHKSDGKDALTREWLDDPSTRRDDIGFRVLYPVEQ